MVFTELFEFLTAFTVFPARIALYLNDKESSTLELALLAFKLHKPPDVSDNYHYIQSNCV